MDRLPTVSAEMGEAVKFLKHFVDNGNVHLSLSDYFTEFMSLATPRIEIAQNRVSHMMLNASSMATFLAGVVGKMLCTIFHVCLFLYVSVATTLQYAEIDLETTVGRVTQTLWFLSLVLTIGSAATSMLASAWRQTIM